MILTKRCVLEPQPANTPAGCTKQATQLSPKAAPLALCLQRTNNVNQPGFYVEPVRGYHIHRKRTRKPKSFLVLLWEQRESNPRPSACKADALNQLSYAPKHFPSKRECKDMNILRTFKFFHKKILKMLQRSRFEMFSADIYVFFHVIFNC